MADQSYTDYYKQREKWNQEWDSGFKITLNGETVAQGEQQVKQLMRDDRRFKKPQPLDRLANDDRHHLMLEYMRGRYGYSRTIEDDIAKRLIKLKHKTRLTAQDKELWRECLINTATTPVQQNEEFIGPKTKWHPRYYSPYR